MATRSRTDEGLLQTALALAARGWPVFRLVPGRKMPFRESNGVSDATTDLDQVRRWWTETPDANVGLAATSTLVFVDVDKRRGADEELRRLQEEHGKLPPTVTVLTSDGFHLYFAVEDGAEVGFGKIGEIEIKAAGKYVLAAGSAHPDGKTIYAYAEGRGPDEIPLAILPEWLRIKRPAAPPAPKGGGDPVDRAKAIEALGALGTWRADEYDEWIHVGMALHATSPDLLDEWDRWSQTSKNKYKEGECAKKWAGFNGSRGLSVGSLIHWAKVDRPGFSPRLALVTPEEREAAENPTTFPLSDMGNGQRLASIHSGRIRYCYPFKTWFVWDGCRWKDDDTGELERMAKDVVRDLDDEVANETSDERRSQLRKWAVHSERLQQLKAMVVCAQSEEGVPVLPDQLDRDRWLLNVQNGTLDLRTGDLREHRQADLITRLIPIPYDPGARADRFTRFLEEITAGDVELQDYLQRLAGYSLVGDTREHSFFVFLGHGRNGKSVLCRMLLRIQGEYGTTIPSETLLSHGPRGGGNATPDLERIRGARLVVASEIEQGQKLNEPLVKALTGGDEITSRGLHREFSGFVPQCTLVLAANHSPRVRGQDLGIWSRVQVVPFRVTFEGAAQEKDLERKLEKELPGILAWAVEGAMAWRRDGGLLPPDSVLDATADYRETEDTLADFFADACVTEPEARCVRTQLLATYRKWCEQAGEKPLRKTDFYREIESRGFKYRKTATSHNVEGIRLKGLPQ